MKILYFSNIIAPYRVGLFNKLDEYFKGDIKFYFDRETESNRKWILNKERLKFSYEIRDTFSYKKNSKASNNSELNRFIYFPFYILFVVLKEKPNVILTSEFGLRTLFAILSGKFIKAKVFVLSEVTEDSEQYISIIKLIFRKYLAKKLEGGIAHGIKSLKYLNILGIEKNRIIISPDAVDNYYESLNDSISKLEARNRLGLSEDKFIFLYVGQFIQRKGLDLLLNVARKLSKSKYYQKVLFVLVGGTEQELREITCNESIKNVKTYKFKDSKSLSYFYYAADCFLLPTRIDVWGLVVNEAVACNLPVAVSKFAGCSDDLIVNDVDGIVFDPLDEKSFFDTIKFCIDNPNKLNQYKINARKKLKIFNHDIAASRIVDFVSQI